MSGSGRDNFSPVAGSVPFDNSTNGFTSDDTQAAIEEINTKLADSASPGFTWGRSGNVNSGAWLLNDTVPSNLAGRTIALTSGLIKKIMISNENANTFVVGIYEHNGVTYTQLTTVSMTAQRSKQQLVSVAITLGKELAVKIESGSCKNVIVGIILSGNLV